MNSFQPFIIFLTVTIFSFFVCFLRVKSLRLLLVLFISIISIFFTLLKPFTFNMYNLFLVMSLLFMQVFNAFRSYELRYSRNTSKIILNNGLKLSVFALLLCLAEAYSLINFISLFSAILCLVSIFGISALVNIKKNLKAIKISNTFSDEELPTVSVLIPARNEDALLADCIQAVIESDYPKLEVIVLDDCSQDSSSEIIKSFAQKGVRFIQGEQPKDNWLAKNQAYNVLANSASGDWLFFMGVDVRLGKKTIKQMVAGALNNHLLMIGVLPVLHAHRLSEILTPLRYYWELALPRFITRHPPALSTCWVIQSDTFRSMGGFNAVSQSVLPERNFAKALDKKYKYAFCRSSDDLYVGTVKRYKEQIDISERLLFPQLRKSMVRLTLMCLMICVSLVPYYYAISSLLDKDYVKLSLTAMSLLPGLLSYFIVFIFQGMQYKFMRLAFLPYLLIQELILAFISAYRYEFSQVIWKGRNVCYPSLRVIPRLPKI